MGVLGALINVQWSLALSAAVVVASAAALFAREARRLDVAGPAADTRLTD